jgi:hypothetical protein
VNRAELSNRLHHHRCGECGFLGAVARPGSSQALADLGEVEPTPRRLWLHKLRTAREGGKLQGSEYDPSRLQDLGLDDATPYGVMCGLRRPEGPLQPTFVQPSRVGGELPSGVPGVIIRDPSAPSSGTGLGSLLGKAVAAVQTPIWPLVRPHACRRFVTYQEGLTPEEHKARSEWLHRWKLGAWLAIGLALLGAVLKWLGG